MEVEIDTIFDYIRKAIISNPKTTYGKNELITVIDKLEIKWLRECIKKD